MENDSQNLKIRVVMKPATDAGVSAQYRYNWARVALIAAPVILLLALAAKFLFDTPDTAPESKVASTPATSYTEAAPPPPAAEPRPEPAKPAATAELAAAPAIEEQDVLERARQLAANNSLAQETQPTDAAPAAEQAPEPVASEPVASEPVTPEPVATETIAESAAAPEPSSSASSAALLPGQNRALSPKVKRFQLTNGIADKEPRGDLEDIQPGSDGLIRVYVFSEVTNMKDDFIHYRWIYNGKQQANVKVGVWSNRWRSNSSKFIAPDMRGDWQVKMENQNGELLAEANFSY